MSMTISTSQQIAVIKSQTCLAKLLSKEVVGTGKGTKTTFLIKLELQDTDFAFEPGDSISFMPENHPTSVAIALKAFALAETDMLFSERKQLNISAKDFFTQHVNFIKPSKHLLAAFGITETSDHPSEHMDVHYILQHGKIKELDPTKIPSLFLPLTPRFYSIASAQSWGNNKLDLLISETSYSIMNEERHGVASHFLCQRANLGIAIEIKLHPSRQFRLPSTDTPIIMIGPGTGVAPFRAFVQERITQNATGAHWLFFGERHQSCDYFFADFWTEAKKKTSLRVDCAFSRDQEEKIYVQHLLLQHQKELWDWIQKGACIYICGDAKHMAKEVEETLKQIAINHSSPQEGLSQEEFALSWIKNLRKEKKLLTDVY